MRVEKYTDEREMEWDDFVLNKACNGTFLQTRRFINYHPVGKFEDASCMIYDSKNRLVAVYFCAGKAYPCTQLYKTWSDRKRQIMRQSLNSTPPVMGGAASGIRPEDYLTMA